MRDWIRPAFDLLQQDLGEQGVITQLTAMGCPEAKAEKLVCFLPLACGRALLADHGIAFSAKFRRMDADGSIGEPIPLASDTDWIAIERWLGTRQALGRDAMRIVGTRSAEFDAVNKALSRGSKASNLVGADPIFRFDDQPAEPEGRKSPSWAFWRRN